MQKSIIGTIVHRGKIKKLEIPKGAEDQVKAAMEYRMLKYPEELKNCVTIESIDSGAQHIQWNFKNPFESGEMIGYFAADGRFIKNGHWTERMRSLNGNPTPMCCGFKMHPEGSGFSRKPEVAWECSFCGKIIPKE